MSMNKYRPHIFVLPEDDANSQIVNGFLLDRRLNARAIQVLPPAGGWKNVVMRFSTDHILEMKNYPNRRIVLIIDFDRHVEERFSFVKNKIPQDLKDRVFVLGVLSNPEDLKTNVHKNFEEIGKSLSNDCSDNTRTMWGHDLLKHNDTELNRMALSIRPLLFPEE